MKRTDVVEQAQAIRNSMDKVTGNLTDADAVSVANLFLPWAAGVDYSVGDRRRFSDSLYKCAQAHTSQTGWEPPNVPALLATQFLLRAEWNTSTACTTQTARTASCTCASAPEKRRVVRWYCSICRMSWWDTISWR